MCTFCGRFMVSGSPYLMARFILLTRLSDLVCFGGCWVLYQGGQREE